MVSVGQQMAVEERPNSQAGQTAARTNGSGIVLERDCDECRSQIVLYCC
jgi:hypothetical protein